MPFYVFFTLTGTPVFLIRKTKIEFATWAFDRHATWSLLLDRGWPKTLKDFTFNFFCLIEKKIELTKQRLLLPSWSQLVIAFDNLLLRQYFGERFWMKWLAIFMWLIGGKYYGERLVTTFISDWWKFAMQKV